MYTTTKWNYWLLFYELLHSCYNTLKSFFVDWYWRHWSFSCKGKRFKTYSFGKEPRTFSLHCKNEQRYSCYISWQVHREFSLAPSSFQSSIKVVGSRPINKGVDKIILLEKQEAIRIFGYMPGLNASRATYFGTLGAYILAHVGCAKDLLRLKDYRK